MYHAGVLGMVARWRGFQVFTKISYAVYLTQFPVYFYNVGTARYSGHATVKDLVTNYNNYWIYNLNADEMLVPNNGSAGCPDCVLVIDSNSGLAVSRYQENCDRKRWYVTYIYATIYSVLILLCVFIKGSQTQKRKLNKN
jgi:hypothetical protein